VKIIQVSAIDSTMNGLLRELNKGILGEGYELICVCSDGPRVEQMRSDGFDVRTINIDRRIAPLRNLKSIYQMYKLFRKEKPDIVHVHTPVASVLGRIAAKLARVPNIIYTAHGFYFHENMPKKQYKFFYTIEKLCAKWFTDYLFTQSAEDGELAIRDKFLPKDKITIIGNGVDVHGKFNPENIDVEKIKKIKHGFKLENDSLVITFIGRLVEEKGIIDLLEAIKLISKENITLIVVGSTGASERDQSMNERLKEYIGHPKVIFTGYRTDIPEILSISDIFCLPSYREGMPRSIIEAMAMQCTVIATNIRGSREEVDHGVNGYIVELNNPQEIAKRIKYLKDNPNKMKGFQQNARKKAVNYYYEKDVVRKQLRIFSKIKGE